MILPLTMIVATMENTFAKHSEEQDLTYPLTLPSAATCLRFIWSFKDYLEWYKLVH